MKSEELGIVIIGRNEGQRLIGCLQSLEKYTNAKVYVDSGSTDGSADAAAKFDVAVCRLNAARPFTAARARNEGAAALLKLNCNTKFVQFVDGDCELVPTWLDRAWEFISSRKDVAVVCGRRREHFPDRSVYNRLCDIEWNSPTGEALACGGDSLVRIEAYTQVGGFRSELIAGEEPEFCARLRQKGWKVWRLDEEMTRHDANIVEFSQWWMRSVRSGYAEAEITLLQWRNHTSSRECRDVIRAILWGGLIPIAIVTATIVYPPASAAVLIYPLQIARIAYRTNHRSAVSWVYATFITAAKFAELQGIFRFCRRYLMRRNSVLIEYKK